MTPPSSFEVSAAGAVVWRDGDDGPCFAVIHRPRYDDWSLPKGKLDPGESFEQAALREVSEEIGVTGDLGAELPSTTYRDSKGRSKIVRYWLMPAREVAFEPNDEVDELRWVAADEARSLLSYPRDLEVLEAAVEQL
jgi:8-oxo-dGTP pyrophosphatase MutT (NUDIX family)